MNYAKIEKVSTISGVILLSFLGIFGILGCHFLTASRRAFYEKLEWRNAALIFFFSKNRIVQRAILLFHLRQSAESLVSVASLISPNDF